ncbi:ubiquinone biosynthesis protein COQ7, mitochondrial isoform X2 [Tachypleus tridentatus]|uniref:ubiquinone biosynthesis protein COQ7, mitochondrial isoform X2 n=1 Tax=Tachypleus tridentatus TaxID=6853 RepID=UPI003FD1D78E
MRVAVMSVVPYSTTIIIRRSLSSRTRHDTRLDKNHRFLVDRILRVDHAGELGADRIYAGQMAVLGRTSVGPLIKVMWDQEKEHLRTFEQLIPKYRVRPTALMPFWNIAGFVLGASTALLGKESAMACTVAVESVITEHYNDQIRELIKDDPTANRELLDVLKRFRDDEQHHHDTGLEHDAEQAPFYNAFSQMIKFGCRGAIWLAERL